MMIEPIVRKTGQGMLIVSALPAFFGMAGVALRGYVAKGAEVGVITGFALSALLVVLGLLVAYRRSLVATAIAFVLAALGCVGSLASIFFGGASKLAGVLIWAMLLGAAARHLYRVLMVIRSGGPMSQ